MNSSVNKMIKLSFFLSIALVVNLLETLVPIPVPLPGVKIGLANFIGLMVLCLYGKKEYVIFNILKVILVAIVRTGFGSSFFIGMSGTVLSTVATLFVYKISKASIYGLSVVGSIFHSLGQVLMIVVIYNNIYMINYMWVLLIVSIISGVITAFIASLTLQRLVRKEGSNL